MTDKELVERLREKADLCLAYDLTAAADAIERLQNEAEGMRSNWSKSVITIKRLKSELTQEKIDNTNLIGELATVTAERDRYKAERDAAVRDMKQNTKCYICKNFPKDNNISHCKHFYNCGLAYINWEWRGLEENT